MEQIREKSEKSSVTSRNQYIITLIVNIMSFSVGTSIGWASPSLPQLQTESSPIGKNLTSNEISWVGSIFALGALFGTLFYGWLSEKIGRFNAILLTTLPELLWWIIVAFQLRLEILIVGRLLAGLAAGGIFVLVPLYTTEISDDKSRGILGSLFIFFINLGTLLSFVAGAYLSYRQNAITMMIFPIIFIVTFYYINPETPQWLFKKGKIQEAEKCLKFLRGIEKSHATPESVKNELLIISQRVEENAESGNVSILEELSHRSSRRGLIIGAILAIVQQLCGCFVFINYTADIFKQAGSSLSPNDSAIIVAVIQIFGSSCSPFAIGNFPRKVVYSLTCVGVILGLLTFGTHGLVGSMIDRGALSVDFDYSALGWIPIATLSFVIFIASVGLLPMTFIMISEILPIKIRSFGISICTAVLWMLSFLLLRFFDNIVELLSLPICLFIFSGFTFFGMIFVLISVPETRNRTNDQIEKLLN